MTVAGDSSGVTMPGLIAMWAAPRSRLTAVNGHLVSDPAELITTLLGLAGTSTVFFKETTDRRHHAVLADPRFLTEVTHTFLIRAPAEIAASCYALQGQRLTLSEIGL